MIAYSPLKLLWNYSLGIFCFAWLKIPCPLYPTPSAAHWANVKGETRNMFNLNLEEREKKFSNKTYSENLMKIGWKIRKLRHFEVLQIFKKHFWKHRYEYANEWVVDIMWYYIPHLNVLVTSIGRKCIMWLKIIQESLYVRNLPRIQ